MYFLMFYGKNIIEVKVQCQVLSYNLVTPFAEEDHVIQLKAPVQVHNRPCGEIVESTKESKKVKNIFFPLEHEHPAHHRKTIDRPSAFTPI